MASGEGCFFKKLPLRKGSTDSKNLHGHAACSALAQGKRFFKRYKPYCALSKSLARSPITTDGVIVFPVVMRGRIEASATRNLLTP